MYTTEKQQYTTDGTNWQDVTPLNTRKGALVERNSETCGYVPPTPTDGYLTFTVPANSPNSSIRFSNPLEYSLNGGAWTSLAANTNSPSIGEGDTLKVRANLMPSTTSGGIGTFSSTGRFNASGYPDSLIFGDNYGQTDLTGYDYTFYALFKDCTYLNDASGLLLSATTLANGCYFSMFENCTSLSTTPTLPAMILAVDCYNSMFFGCTSLTTAPALPATTLALDCYNSMFFGCTALVSVPSNLLPATALTEGCYRFMFCDCSSLVVAPDLSSATALPRTCYEGMFENCVSLNYIKMMATDVSAYYCLNNWVYGVQTNSGTFVKSPCVQIPTGTSGIPNNWTVVEETVTQERWVDVAGEFVCQGTDKYQKQKKQISTDCGSTWSDSSPLEVRAGSLIETGSSDCTTPTGDYLTFTSLEDGNKFQFYNRENRGLNMSYSIDNGSTWTNLSFITFTPVVNSGESIKFRSTLIPGDSGIGHFESYNDKRFKVSGCPDSLIFGDNYGQSDLTGYDDAFYELFDLCSGLVDISELSLPATTLGRACYYKMFWGCSVRSIPSNLLPATTLTEYCYANMFSGCYFTSIPSNLLPATTLTAGCYSGMFSGCALLTTAPELPATTLARSCYFGMFWGCSSLVTAPELLATTLASYCYERMFQDCTSLNYIKMMATNISATGCLTVWVYGVASKGTFYKKSGVTIPRGNSGIPSGWKVVEV